MNRINIDALHLEKENLNDLGPGLMKIGLVLFAVGLIAGLAFGIGEQDQFARFAHSYLVNYCYFLSLSLGAMIFVLLQHLMRARWSVCVRRVAEIISAILPVWAVMFIPILILSPQIYGWMNDAESHGLHGFKAIYFNPIFFIARMAFCFSIWIFASRFLLQTSFRQDRTGDAGHTVKLERFSPASTILFAISVTIFSFDVIMSLDYHWYSTIFGVYYFSGCLAGFLALFILTLRFIQHKGCLIDLVTTSHYHDIGRLLFALVVFWAYIAFSQYLLIWYANIPEETVWYLRRQEGQWGAVSIVLIFGHFVIPFLALMSQHVKRHALLMVALSAWILIMHWIDIYWLIMPAFNAAVIPIHILDALLFVMFFGAGLTAAGHLFRAGALIPTKDPRLEESLNLH